MADTKAKPLAKTGITGRQKRIKTFTVDYTDLDGNRFYGSFTTKKMSVSDIASLGVRKSQLNGGMYHDVDNPGMGVDATTDDFNAMIAHLDIALEAWPKWWDLDEIVDPALIGIVFEEVMSHEQSFLVGRRNSSGSGEGEGSGPDGTGQDSGSGDSGESDTGGMASAVVDEEVLDSLEP